MLSAKDAKEKFNRDRKLEEYAYDFLTNYVEPEILKVVEFRSHIQLAGKNIFDIGNLFIFPEKFDILTEDEQVDLSTVVVKKLLSLGYSVSPKIAKGTGFVDGKGYYKISW